MKDRYNIVGLIDDIDTRIPVQSAFGGIETEERSLLAFEQFRQGIPLDFTYIPLPSNVNILTA